MHSKVKFRCFGPTVAYVSVAVKVTNVNHFANSNSNLKVMLVEMPIYRIYTKTTQSCDVWPEIYTVVYLNYLLFIKLAP